MLSRIGAMRTMVSVVLLLMTLTACHPMYSARERYIVHAEFERWQPRDAGAPVELAGQTQG